MKAEHAKQLEQLQHLLPKMAQLIASLIGHPPPPRQPCRAQAGEAVPDHRTAGVECFENGN